jgi:type I restriction enzyme S subunit
MYTFNINYTDIEDEDKLVAPYYRMKMVIAKIQEKYTLKSIDELADYCISGSYIPSYSSEGQPYLRVHNIRSFEIGLNSDDMVFVDPKYHKIPDKIRVKCGDVVLVRTTISISNFGNAAIISHVLENSVISQHVTKIGISEFDPYFFVCIMNSNFVKNQLVSIGYGSTRLELTHDQLRKVLIPIIPKKFQKEIADKIKNAIERQEKALQNLNKAKNTLIKKLDILSDKTQNNEFYSVLSDDLEEMLTPKFYYPLYLKTLRAIEKKFKTTSLNEIADISKGEEVGSENYRNYLEKTDSDVPFIRTSDIVNNEIDNYPDFYVSESIYNELNQDIQPGDILFTKDGKIGLSAMLVEGDKCILASGIARIRVKKHNPYYIFAVLDTFIGKYQAEQRTVISSTIPHLRPERLGEIKIPIIPETEQKEISQLVKEAFKLKQEKKFLIRQAKDFTEKLLQ